MGEAQLDEAVFGRSPGEWERQLTEGQGLTAGEARSLIWRRCASASVALDAGHLTTLAGLTDALEVDAAIAVLARVEQRPWELQADALYPLTRYESAIGAALAAQAPAALTAAEASGRFGEPAVHGVRVHLFACGQLDALPEATLALLARNYLDTGARHTDPLFARLLPGLPAVQWRQAQLRQLVERHIYGWSPRHEALLPEASDEDVFVLCASAWRGAGAVFEEAVRRRETLRARFEAAAASSEASGVYGWVVWLMRAADGEVLDAAFDEALLGYLVEWSANIELAMQLVRLLPTDRAAALVADALEGGPRARTWRRNARSDAAQQVFGIVQAPELYELALRQVGEASGASSSARVRLQWGFVAGGAYARAFVVGALSRKLPASVMAFLLEVLGELEAEPTVAVYTDLLGHGARTVREVAIARLAQAGDRVLGDLRPLLVKGRKVVRQAAVEVLRQLPETPVRQRFIAEVRGACAEDILGELSALVSAEPSPLEQVAAVRQALSILEVDTIKALWRGWVAQGLDVPRLREVGLPALLVLHEELGGHAVRRKPGMWVNGALALADEPLAAWAVASTISTSPDFRIEPFLRELARMGAMLVGPLIALAAESPHRGRVLDLLGTIAPLEAMAVLIEGLSDPSRPTREAAVGGLVKAGSASVASLLEVLRSRRKDARQAAAEALALIGDVEAAPALEAAIRGERSAEVATAMRRALAASEPPADVDVEGDSEEALGRWLATQAPAELPDFVKLGSLPAVRFASGQALSDPARLGWIGMLSLETDEQPNLLARRLAVRLLRDDVTVLGAALVAAWEADGEPVRHRWALEQMAISGSERWIYEVGRRVRSTYAQRQSMGRVHLGILARHDSPVARFWLQRGARAGDGWSYREEVRKAWRRRCAYEGATARELEGLADADLAREAEETRHVHGFHGESTSFWVGEVIVRARLMPWPVPPAGQWAERLALAVYETSRGSESVALESAEMRMAVASSDEIVRRVDQDVARWLAELRADVERGRRWTVRGWERAFIEHPVMRRVMALGLFEQVEPSRQRFGVRLDGAWVDLDGAVVALPDGARVTLVLPEQVGEEERARWSVVLADTDRAFTSWMAEDRFERHTSGRDAFGELRALLYEGTEARSWTGICASLSTWPDESLHTAIEYANAHLAEMPASERVSPEPWAASLVSPRNRHRLALRGLGKAVTEGADPRLQVCGELHFDGFPIKREDAEALMGSAHIGHIRGLSFYDSHIYAEAIASLLKRDAFPVLERLSVARMAFGLRVWRQLLGAPWLARVVEYGFDDCGLGDEHVEVLVASGRLRGVRALSLMSNALGGRAIEALARCRDLESLESLDLRYCQLGESACVGLVRSPHLRAIKAIDLGGNDLRGRGWATFVESEPMSERIRAALAVGRG